MLVNEMTQTTAHYWNVYGHK